MRARINKNVHVHKEPGRNKRYIQPEVLWIGYHVDIVDHYQGPQYRWAKIRYLYNNKNYEGWVIEEALDVERVMEPPLDPLNAPLPIPNSKINYIPDTSFPWRVAAAVVIGIALLAAAVFAL